MKLLLLAALALSSPSAQDGYISGIVSSVHDGDTLTIGEERIRLWGIGAPELSDKFGVQSGTALRQLTLGQSVTCTRISQSYNRTVARCEMQDGRDVAQVMVATGWARDWPEFSRGEYKPAQRTAKAKKLGIWGGQ